MDYSAETCLKKIVNEFTSYTVSFRKIEAGFYSNNDDYDYTGTVVFYNYLDLAQSYWAKIGPKAREIDNILIISAVNTTDIFFFFLREKYRVHCSEEPDWYRILDNALIRPNIPIIRYCIERFRPDKVDWNKILNVAICEECISLLQYVRDKALNIFVPNANEIVNMLLIDCNYKMIYKLWSMDILETNTLFRELFKYSEDGFVDNNDDIGYVQWNTVYNLFKDEDIGDNINFLKSLLKP